MRNAILGLMASVAVAASAAPASACDTFGGCGFRYGYSGYGGYGYLGAAPYDRLPEPRGQYAPSPRPQVNKYYFVNQGPVYSGPGLFAPYPTYQETAVRGWTGYERGIDYPYDGGPYAGAFNHFSDAAPEWQGPVVYSYRWQRGRTYRPRVQYFGVRHGVRTGFAARASAYRVAGPGVVYAPRFKSKRQ